jgi:hypothetical protein
MIWALLNFTFFIRIILGHFFIEKLYRQTPLFFGGITVALTVLLLSVCSYDQNRGSRSHLWIRLAFIP